MIDPVQLIVPLPQHLVHSLPFLGLDLVHPVESDPPVLLVLTVFPIPLLQFAAFADHHHCPSGDLHLPVVVLLLQLLILVLLPRLHLLFILPTLLLLVALLPFLLLYLLSLPDPIVIVPPAIKA